MSRDGQKKNQSKIWLIFTLSLLMGGPLVKANPAQPALYEKLSQKTEYGVREKIVPLLTKYCASFCELISVKVDLDEDISVAEDMGFESAVPEHTPDLIVRKIDANIQIDERIGSENRTRLAKIVEIHLASFAMSAQVNWIPVRMPKIPGIRDEHEILDDTDDSSAAENVGGGLNLADRVKLNPAAEQMLRRGIEEKITSALNGVISQYCPNQCLIERVDVAGELASKAAAGGLLQSQYAADPKTGAIFRVQSVQADITVDAKIEERIRDQILKMMQARTRFVTPVYINVGVIDFPESYAQKMQRENISETDPYGLEKLRQMLIMFRDLAGTKEIVTNTNSTATNESLKTEKSDATLHATHDTTASTNTNSTNNSSTNTHTNSTQKSSNTIATNNTTATHTNSEMVKTSAEEKESIAGVFTALSPHELMAYAAGFLVLLGLIIIAVARFARTSKEAGAMMDYGDEGAMAVPTFKGGQIHGEAPTQEAGPADRDLALGVKAGELKQELVDLFMQNPKVARDTFGRILKEDGVEMAAKYLHIFGHLIIYELLNDPGLQRELYELSEYYHNSSFLFTKAEELELLQRLKTRVTASEIRVLTQKSSEKFEFLQKLEPGQIYNLIVDENIQVQCIVLTQLDRKRRRMVFDLYQGDSKVRLMEQLSMAEAIPKDYMYNVAKVLAKKVAARSEFDTENLRSSDVLMDFLEKADIEEQRHLMSSLQKNNPDTARALKLKLVTVEVMPFLKDGHLLELVLGMERADLLVFLAGTKPHIRDLLLKKAPDELADSWIEELETIAAVDEQVYKVAEMKVLGRIRLLTNSGTISLLDINERIFMVSDTQYKVKDEGVMPLKKATLVA